MREPPLLPELRPETVGDFLHHYKARARLLFEREPELRERYASASCESFAKYVDTEAILYFRELQEAAIPFPPSSEMITVGGETDLRRFLSTGYGCFERVRAHLPQSREALRLLDFGAGCGRTMRHFYRTHRQWQCYGCDVDRAAIRYLEKSLPFVTATHSPNRPPLSYSDAFFDCIYSVSVFTHLSDEAFGSWIEELARVSKPGATVLLTLHGRPAMQKLADRAERRSMMGLDDGEFSRALETFEKDGFAWLAQPVGSADIDSDRYGICFIAEESLRDRLEPFFEFGDYRPGDVEGWQDLAVLGRR